MKHDTNIKHYALLIQYFKKIITDKVQMNIIADLIQTLFVFISEIQVCLQVTN